MLLYSDVWQAPPRSQQRRSRRFGTRFRHPKRTQTWLARLVVRRSSRSVVFQFEIWKSRKISSIQLVEIAQTA